MQSRSRQLTLTLVLVVIALILAVWAVSDLNRIGERLHVQVPAVRVRFDPRLGRGGPSVR